MERSTWFLFAVSIDLHGDMELILKILSCAKICGASIGVDRVPCRVPVVLCGFVSRLGCPRPPVFDGAGVPWVLTGTTSLDLHDGHLDVQHVILVRLINSLTVLFLKTFDCFPQRADDLIVIRRFSSDLRDFLFD